MEVEVTSYVNKGDVVQIVNPEHHWYPCLIIVSEVKSWGIQGYLSIPKDNKGQEGSIGQAYIRLSTGNFEVIGKASVVRFQ